MREKHMEKKLPYKLKTYIQNIKNAEKSINEIIVGIYFSLSLGKIFARRGGTCIREGHRGIYGAEHGRT